MRTSRCRTGLDAAPPSLTHDLDPTVHQGRTLVAAASGRLPRVRSRGAVVSVAGRPWQLRISGVGLTSCFRCSATMSTHEPMMVNKSHLSTIINHHPSSSIAINHHQPRSNIIIVLSKWPCLTVSSMMQPWYNQTSAAITTSTNHHSANRTALAVLWLADPRAQSMISLFLRISWILYLTIWSTEWWLYLQSIKHLHNMN